MCSNTDLADLDTDLVWSVITSGVTTLPVLGGKPTVCPPIRRPGNSVLFVKR